MSEKNKQLIVTSLKQYKYQFHFWYLFLSISFWFWIFIVLVSLWKHFQKYVIVIDLHLCQPTETKNLPQEWHHLTNAARNLWYFDRNCVLKTTISYVCAHCVWKKFCCCRFFLNQYRSLFGFKHVNCFTIICSVMIIMKIYNRFNTLEWSGVWKKNCHSQMSMPKKSLPLDKKTNDNFSVFPQPIYPKCQLNFETKMYIRDSSETFIRASFPWCNRKENVIIKNKTKKKN